MNDSPSSYHLQKGREAFARDNTLLALYHFDQIPAAERTPETLSSLAVCVAREKNNLRRALELCGEALERERNNPLHYLHLGRIYILAKKKHLAIMTFRRGLRHGRHQGLIDELQRLGRRRSPHFPALGRKHPLNKFLGLLSHRLGIS